MVGSSWSAPDGDEDDHRAGRRLLERLEQLVGGRLVEAQTFGVEQHDDLALALDRAARHLVDDRLRVLDADLRRRRVDLDHVGMHAAQREVPRALVVVGAR